MKLENCTLQRWSSALAGLGLFALLGCLSEDSTRVVEQEELEPASTQQERSGSIPSDAAGAQPSATPAGDEAGPANVTREPAREGVSPAPTAPAGPIEYWPDGVSVDGVSADVDDRFHGVTMDAEDNAYAVGYLGNGLGDDRA